MEAQGHELTFIPSGEDRLEALLALIDSANATLRLCFYIYAEDAAGTRVRDALTAAADRGVAVTLILDGFGVDASEAFFAPLKEAGGTCLRFMPRWTRRYLIRNHQKLVLVDEDAGMIGGFNIADDYFASTGNGGWADLGILVRGPAVGRLCQWFAQLEAWTFHSKAQFRGIRRLVREWDPGDGPVQVLLGGPTRRMSSWARRVSQDLEHARKLDLAAAYFSPATLFLGRIARVARRGQSRFLLPAKTDNGATLGAARILYGKLFKRGARIWEFTPAKLHMKMLVLDDIVYIGSANFDVRSLYINLELMLRIEDRALAERMREFLSAHLAVSMEITPEIHKRRATVFNRARWALSWFIVAVVDYTVSRKLNLGL